MPDPVQALRALFRRLLSDVAALRQRLNLERGEIAAARKELGEIRAALDWIKERVEGGVDVEAAAEELDDASEEEGRARRDYANRSAIELKR